MFKALLIAAIALSLSACTGLQIRDNAAQTGQTLYHAYDRALSHQLDQRYEWRQACAGIHAKEQAIIFQYIDEQETLEDKLAAIDLAKERHNKALPELQTLNAFTDGDGQLLNAANQVKC